MILVGTPSYDGKIGWQTVSGLIELGHICAQNRIGYAMDLIPGDAFIGHARNMIAHRFLKMGFRDLMFVDADIGFEAADAVKLCRAEPELACGLYRIKKDRMVYPARFQDPPEYHPSDPNLIRLHWGPAGFMRIRATVFEKMKAAFPDDWYMDSATGEKVYDFFPGGRHGNHFSSEDVAFCDRARACGIELWCLQGIALTHTGTKTWESKWQLSVPTLTEAVNVTG